MSATGIGAAVRRKEDLRFITGKGQYTDDIIAAGRDPRPFRPLAARARQDQEASTRKAAKEMPGVVAVLTGARSRRRQDRQSDLRLDDPFQGRLADEDVGASGDRRRQGQPCRRCGRGGDRRDAGAGARTRPRRSRSTTRCCRRSPIRPRRRRRARRRSTTSRRTTRSTSGISATQKATDAAFKSRQARHQARHHQQPAGAERDRAARRDRRIRCRQRQLHALEHVAEPACGAARDRGLRRHGAGAQAARDRAGCRRRLRLEDLHLSGRGRLPVGVDARSAGR